MTVNPNRFLDKATRALIEAWRRREPERPPVWAPLAKPLSECTVACVTTAALALEADEPFDQEGERRDPWWGDPSHRVIPRGVTSAELRCWHLHIDPRHPDRDFNCVLPLDRLEELADSGEIGAVAPRHYSVQGYQVRGEALWTETAPRIARELKKDAVDAVLLVPV